MFTRDGVLKLCGLGEPRWLAVPPPQGDGEPSLAGDLAALGHIAAGWAAVTPTAKSGKNKGLPDKLQHILSALPSRRRSQALRQRRGAARGSRSRRRRLPANTAAWERFVRQVREESADNALRESA